MAIEMLLRQGRAGEQSQRGGNRKFARNTLHGKGSRFRDDFWSFDGT
jgi:hypothetical protein